MAIRLSGMSSGLDTESIVSALVSGYKTKKEKYQKAQTKLSWTQDAWKDVNKKVYSLYSGLDSLRFSSGYSLKKTTVSDATKATVSASGSAFNGTQKLVVNKTATTGSLTGGKLGASVSTNTKMAELGFTGRKANITLTKGDGSTATFEAGQQKTVGDFVNFLKDNGLSANYDTAQQRIYVNAKSQGKDADFMLTADDDLGFEALSALGVNVKSETATAAYSSLAQYANTAGENETAVYSSDNSVIEGKIRSAVSEYKTAGTTITDANEAAANLSNAYGYATSYADMRDALTKAGLDINGSDKETIEKLMEIAGNWSSADDTIIDGSGNTYSIIGGNGSGDTVYRRLKDGVDAENATRNDYDYITEHLTGNLKTKDKGTFIKQDESDQVKFGSDSDDSKIDVYKVAGDENLYRLDSSHKLVQIQKAKDDEGNELGYYEDVEGFEAISTEPEIEYYAGQETQALTVYKDADDKEYIEGVGSDDQPNGIFSNGGKFYRAVEGTDDEGNPTYTLIQVQKKKDAEGKEVEGNNATDYEDVEDGAQVIAKTKDAEGDYYFLKNDISTAPESTGTRSTHQWVNDFFDGIADTLATAEGWTSDEKDTKLNDFRQTLMSNMASVYDYELHAKVDKLKDKQDGEPYAEYSISNIVKSVKEAYEGATPGNGADAVDELATGFGAAMSAAKNASKQASETQEKYSDVASLASMDESSAEFDEAVEAMIDRVKNAANFMSKDDKFFNSDAKKVDGQDAEIELGGIEYTSSNNNFSINGLSIQTLAETGAEGITITTSNDTQGIYDKIKDFITNYNDVINELTELYNAASSKGYDPLTEDEKSEMSDKQVEQWETKIKDSLLRRDQNLGNIITTMTNAMAKTYSVGGKNYSLASFGIKTLGILKAANNQQNAYHIDGDEDDTITSANADKLMNMLTSDPDTVVSFMQQLTNGIHSSMEQKMRTSTLSSAYTIYNDKEMASEYSDYTKLIKTWETRMSDAESRYQKQFTQMEKALAQLNSNSSAVSGLFG